MKKKLPGKMGGLKTGKPAGKAKPTMPFFMKGKEKNKMAKGGKVNCYAEGGPVSSQSGVKVSGVARGMGAAKRGGNFEY